MIDSSEIKEIAKQRFRSQYGICVGALLLIGLVLGAIDLFGEILDQLSDNYSILHEIIGWPNPITLLNLLLFIYLPLRIFLVGPLEIGRSSFTIRIYRGQQGDIADMYRTGFVPYGRNLGGYLWMQVFIFLWSVLLVIPGIVKSIAYSMTPFLLADCPNMNATDAIKISMRMTDGFKGDIFVFYLSFIGWHILNALTLGILGIFYVTPYYRTSLAGLYEELKRNAIETGEVTLEELA